MGSLSQVGGEGGSWQAKMWGEMSLGGKATRCCSNITPCRQPPTGVSVLICVSACL